MMPRMPPPWMLTIRFMTAPSGFACPGVYPFAIPMSTERLMLTFPFPRRLMCENTAMRFWLLLLITASLRADSVALSYLGTAGWQITSGKTVILVDPYLSRVKYPSPNDGVSPDDPRPLVAGDSIVEPDAAVIDAHIQRADYIFLTHTHPDHSLDMPYIARKTGARVIGTESTANVARAYAVPEGQIQVVKGGEELQFDGFSVRVIRSLHGLFRKPAPGQGPAPPPLVPAGLKAPLRFGQS